MNLDSTQTLFIHSLCSIVDRSLAANATEEDIAEAKEQKITLAYLFWELNLFNLN